MFRSPRPFSLLAIAVCLLLTAFRPAHAIKGMNADGTLDKPVVSKAYFEGEFWTVINALEAFRKSGMDSTREDSVYTFKYLSVVYAADPTTRKKAESYMYQLLRMMPTIDLLDLYISDNIESIFKKVKSDYEKLEKLHPAEASAAEPAPAKTASNMPPAPAAVAAQPDAIQGNPPAPAMPVAKEKGKGKSGIRPWVPITAGAVGVLAAAFLVVTLTDESAAKTEVPRPVEVTVVTPNQGSQ